MFVQRLKLINFRNYDNLDIELDKKLNIFYGYNAQGKTNILEALYFVACARSHRTKKDKELINLKSDTAYISLLLNKSLNTKIDIKLCEEKKIRINDIEVKKYSELIGNLKAVLFSPEDLKLVKEGPSEKRRFLDIGISQIKPSYFYNLMQYIKVLNHRNALLREAKNQRSLLDTISVWDNNLVEIGSKIMYHRYGYLSKINEKAKIIHKKMADEDINIKYIPSVKIDDFSNIEEIRTVFLKTLSETLQKDLLSGYTSVGPHRDNFDVLLNSLDSKTYASQGQQRTSVLSLKLSEVEIIKSETEEIPILLLDDVMSELDDLRQQYLFQNISDVQTFITCTNIDKYIKFNAKFFEVRNGEIKVMEGS